MLRRVIILIMTRNIFITSLLFFLLFGDILPVCAVTISQEVLASPDDSGGVFATPTVVVPTIIIPPVPPVLVPETTLESDLESESELTSEIEDETPSLIPEPTPPLETIVPSVLPSEVPSIPTASEIVGTFVETFTSAFSSFSSDVSNGIVNVATNIFNVATEKLSEAVTQVSIASEVVVEKTNEYVNSPVGKTVTKVVEPVGVASGVVVAVSQVAISTATMTVTSFSDIYLVVWRLIGLLFGAGKRKGKPWGTVYDSITKRPLDPAYVIVSKESGEEISDAITDLDGRYGFLVPTGSYKIKASKTNYSFPTKTLENRSFDELYDNIYHGEATNIEEGEIVIRNIPLDPIGFDWNEFEKNKQNLFRIYSNRERFWKRFFDVLYTIGFGTAVISTVFNPTTVNIIFFSLYFLFVIYNLKTKDVKKAVSVRYANNLEPIPYAIIKVFFADLDSKIKTIVADHLGRFYFLVAPGKYYFTIDKKQADGSYVGVYVSPKMDLPLGVLNEDVLV